MNDFLEFGGDYTNERPGMLGPYDKHGMPPNWAEAALAAMALHELQRYPLVVDVVICTFKGLERIRAACAKQDVELPAVRPLGTIPIEAFETMDQCRERLEQLNAEKIPRRVVLVEDDPVQIPIEKVYLQGKRDEAGEYTITYQPGPPYRRHLPWLPPT